MGCHSLLLVAIAVALALVVFLLLVEPDEPLTVNVLNMAMGALLCFLLLVVSAEDQPISLCPSPNLEHVDCPENSVKVLEPGLWKVHCMCVNGMFGQDCSERVASQTQVDDLAKQVGTRTHDIDALTLDNAGGVIASEATCF